MYGRMYMCVCGNLKIYVCKLSFLYLELYCKCRFRNVCRVYHERRYVGYRAYVALRYAT